MSPNLMRLCCFLIAAACAAPLCGPSLFAHAQASPKLELPADIILPQPPPTSPISAWHDSEDRKTVKLVVNGHELRGFRYPGHDPKAPEILFFNGNGMTVLRTDRFYRSLAALGPSVTVYDYRGFGFTPGPAHLATYRTDGLAIYDELLKQAPSHKIIVYGASMGTTVAAYVASQRPVAALILGMPIASVEEELPVYARLLGFSNEMISGAQVSSEAHDIFAEIDLLKAYHAPLVVLGGGADTVVPIAQAHEVYEASPASNKRFIEVPGATHNEVILSAQSMSAVSDLLKQLH